MSENPVILSKKSIFFILLSIFIAIILRIYDLKLRPMHGDEAINAFKFSELLEHNNYDYDPKEYHGPTLYYFSLPFAWLSGEKTLNQLSEQILRLVTATFGLLLILLLFFVRKYLGKNEFLTALFFLAVSPAFVFYSRYYIHEMLFVFFSFAMFFSFYIYYKNPSFSQAIFAGLFLGLLVSTKETWIIPVFAALVTFSIVWLSEKKTNRTIQIAQKSKWIFIIPVISALICTTFYSAFFSDWDGIYYFLKSFAVYFNRAGNSDFHIHPWYQYLDWLMFSGIQKDAVFSELLIAVLGIVGMYSVFMDKNNTGGRQFGRILALFTIINLLFFSLIPYKTPWNLLTFWFGFTILSGYGFTFILHKLNTRLFRIVFYSFLILAAVNLVWQSYNLNFNFYDRKENPYAYAQPVRQITKLVDTITDITGKSPELFNSAIQIFAPQNDYWPLPWYLRKFKKIGWYNNIDDTIPAAPLIIYNPVFEKDLVYKLYQYPPPGQRLLYIPFGHENFILRMGVEFKIIVQKDFWDKIQ